jgi:Bacterial SH3 domain
MTHYPELPPAYYIRPRPRVPWLRGGFLLAVGLFVVGFLVSSDVRDWTRAVAAQAATWAAEQYAATEPPRPHGVAAEDFAPERGAFASAAGANVRDYPLPHADILVELPARAPLNITGRLNVQGNWWYRVVLGDGRIGFVHQSVIAWGSPPAARAQVANVTAVEPAIPAAAGRAGAKIRVGPARNARVIVRVAAGAELSVTGRRRIGEHTWYRVRTEDGQEGFARDDVLTAPGGGALHV